MIAVRRALVSMHDKTGLEAFGRALHGAGVELVSTGGTARALEASGLPVTAVSTVTGFPEVFGGRVKTLHPLIHGGLLYRRGHEGDEREASENGIRPIDLVAVSLYPFEATVGTPGVTRSQAIEQIDIGGPAMIRASAKNHAHVVVVTDPADYEPVLAEIRSGGVSPATSARLAVKAFQRTSEYDRAIASWLGDHPPGE
jgi:phosphoribosylaminoimidazolecarboxamide formyltransferase/IMP cyclohydrolase